MSKCYFDINIDNNEVGRLEFDLYDDDVPKTVENFKELCLREPRKGYKGSCFHRIIPNFMAQGGDYTVGNGTGGRAIFDGGKFDDENFKRKHTKEGILSMANCGKNTNGSQFFITFGKTEWLDGRHVVFGEVVKGFDVLNQIKKVGTQDGKPTKKVIISDCGVL